MFNKSIIIAIAIAVFVSACAVVNWTGLSAIKFDNTQHPEITFGQGETISNETDGVLDFGAANLTTTGSFITSIVLSDTNSYTQADRVYLGYTGPDSNNAYGAIYMKAYNKGVSGANIAAYDVVQLDTTKVELAADTTKTKRARITNNIQFSMFAWVRVTRPATTNADTVYIYGKDPAGSSVAERVVAPAGSQSFATSDNLYSDVDSIYVCKVGGNTGDYQFDAYYYNSVIASAGSTQLVCGVAPAAIADSGGTGWIVIRGYAKATVDAATLIAMPGTLLHGASGGDAVTIAAATADSTKNAKILGHAMQPSFKDNTAILIYVDPR